MRMEAQVALLTELQDFFRRRGELELDYSKNLDKLAKSIQLRHKEQKQKYLNYKTNVLLFCIIVYFICSEENSGLYFQVTLVGNN